MRHVFAVAASLLVAAQVHAQRAEVHLGAGVSPGSEGTHVLGSVTLAPRRTVSVRADILMEGGGRSAVAPLVNVQYHRGLFGRPVYLIAGAGVNLDAGLPVATAAGAGLRLRDTSLPLSVEGRVFSAPDQHLLLTVGLRL